MTETPDATRDRTSPWLAPFRLLARHYKLALLALVILALAAWLWRQWQGPLLPGYRVTSGPLVQTLVASGRIITLSRVRVGSEITGQVLERRVLEGDRVAPGDILAVLRSDEQEAQVREARAALAELQESRRPQARAAVRQALTQWQQAQRTLERQQTLLRQGNTSREALEQAQEAETLARVALERAQLELQAVAVGGPGETQLRARLAAAEAALERTRIRARVSGLLLTRAAEPGDVVQPGQVLFEIARDGDMEILVPLDEEHLERLRLGQWARCVADAYPDRPFRARLHFIAPRVDPELGTLEVRLKVDPVPDFLRQDMTVSINLETGRRERTLAIPNDAFVTQGSRQAEVLQVREGRLWRRRIELGMAGISMTEVRSGLEPGDIVLADPTLALEEGARVRVRLREPPPPRLEDATSGELPVRFD